MASDDTSSVQKAFRLDGLPEYVSGVVRDEVKKALESGEMELISRSVVINSVRERLRSVLDTSLSDEVNRSLDNMYDEIERQTGGLIKDGKLDTAFVERFSNAVGRETTAAVKGGLDYILKGELPPELLNALNEGPDRLQEYFSRAQECLPGEQLAKLKNKILSKPLLTIPNEVYGGLLAASASRHFALAYKGAVVDEYELQRGIEVTKVLVWQVKNKDGLSLTVGDFVSFVDKIKTELGLDKIGWIASIDGKIDQLGGEFKKLEDSINRLDATIINGGMLVVNDAKALVNDIKDELGDIREKVFGPILQAGREVGESVAFLNDGLPRNFDDIIDKAGLSGSTFDQLAHSNAYESLDGMLAEELGRINAVIAESAAELAGNITADAVNVLQRTRILDFEKIPKQNPSFDGPYDPVLLHNGEFYHDVTDLMIPGRMIDYEFKRIYRSRSVFVGPLGHNWTHNYDERLYFRGDGVTYVDGEGKKFFFAKRLCHSEGGTTEESPVPKSFNGRSFASLRMTGNCYISPKGQFSELAMDSTKSGAGYVLRERHGLERRFRTDGRLLSIADRFGNALRFEYDDKRRLSKVIDSLDREIKYHYNDAGLLSVVEDFIGRKVKFEYDKNLDLVRATHPATWDFPHGKSTQYRYSNGNSDGALNHNLEAIIDPKNQRYLMNVYSSEGYSKDMVIGQFYGDPKYLMRAGYRPLGVPWIALLGDDELNIPVQRADVSNRSGVQHFYIHNEEGNLLKKGYLDPSGREIVEEEHRYNADGMRVSTKRRDGLVVMRQYDANNPKRLSQADLLSVKHVPSDGLAPREYRYAYTGRYQLLKEEVYPCGLVTRYLYDLDEKGAAGKGSLKSIKKGAAETQLTSDRYGRVTSVSEPLGVINKYEYGKYLDRIVQQASQSDRSLYLETRYKYDEVGNRIAIVDPEGEKWIFRVNRLNQVTEVVAPESLSYAKRYRYDANNNIIEEAVSDSGSVHIKYNYEYDILDHLTSAQMSGGDELIERRFEHDPEERISSVVEPEGEKTTYTYTDSGKLKDVSRGGVLWVQYEYDDQGRLNRAIDGEGNATSYQYNGFGEVLSIAGPDGLLVDLERDVSGRIVARRALANGSKIMEGTRFAYDEYGRVIERQRSLLGESGSGNDDQVESFEYNVAGYLASYVDAAHRVFQYHYDGLGRLANVDVPLNNRVKYKYDKRGNLLEWSIGRLVTGYKYDAMGRLIYERRQDGTKKEWRYGVLNQPISIAEDGFGATVFEYDGLGRPVATSQRAAGSVFETKYRWDRSGRLVGISDPNGSETSYMYDASDRLVAMKRPDGGVYKYAYNHNDGAVEAVDARGNVMQNKYDAVGRLVERNINRAKGVKGTTLQRFSYDQLGRLLSSFDNNDPDDRSDDSLLFYYYDSLSRQTAERQNTFWWSKAFDAADQAVAVTNGGSGVVSRRFDLLDRITEVKVDETLTGEWTYPEIGPEITSLFSNGVSAENVYDSALRLRQTSYKCAVSGQLPNTRYTYNNDGLLSYKITDKRFDYHYDAMGRLTGCGQCSQETDGKVEFDPDGNRLKLKELQFAYDALNRLVSVRSGNGAEIAGYSYDVHYRRISKRRFAGKNMKTEYLYDGWDLLAAYEDGRIARQYYNKDTLSAPFAVRNYDSTASGLYFNHTDRLGSVLAVTDEEGAVIENREYASFGELGSRLKNGFLHDFTGAIHDEETGLLYFRHRYYDATSGRFLTQDPLGFKNQFSYDTEWPRNTGRIYGPQRRYSGGGVWSHAVSNFALPEMDLYQYAKGNPLYWTDPLGLKIIVNGNIEDYNAAHDYLMRSPQAAEVIRDLESSRRRIEVTTSGRYTESHYDPSSRSVQWNSAAGSVAQTYGIQSPAISLIHEFAHARNDIRGVLQSDRPSGDAYHTVEERNVIQGVEWSVAQQLGEPVRMDHSSTSIVVPSVMYHELWYDGSYDGENDYRRRFETIPSTRSIYFNGQSELFMTQPLLPKKG